MATKRELVNRWETGPGPQTAATVLDALLQHGRTTRGKDLSELRMDGELIEILRSHVADLSFVHEVTPALDLRGFGARWINIAAADLSASRFDFARLRGHIDGCLMVGVVCDGADFSRMSLKHDFHAASFVGATLKDCYFGNSHLEGANFSDAKLQCANFNGASCRGARFINAKMRFAHCPKADLRGADLSDADLTEAVLGGVQFDAGTRLTGTVLTGASMTKDFAEFVRKAGAIGGDDQSSYELTQLKAAKVLLERENGDGSLSSILERLPDLRERIRKTPTLDWLAELQEGQTPEVAANLEYIYDQASKMISQFAD